MEPWQPKRFQMPAEPKALSAAVIIFGLALILAFGQGPLQDFLGPGGTKTVEGRLVAFDRLHPLRADRQIPTYAWRTPDNAIQLVTGTRFRTSQTGFARKAMIRYVPGDPSTAFVLGQYDDQRPIVGFGFLLVLAGVWVRTRKPRDDD